MHMQTLGNSPLVLIQTPADSSLDPLNCSVEGLQLSRVNAQSLALLIDQLEHPCAAVIQENRHEDHARRLEHDVQLFQAPLRGPKAGREHWYGYAAVMNGSFHGVPAVLSWFKAGFIHEAANASKLQPRMQAADKGTLDVCVGLCIKSAVAKEHSLMLQARACTTAINQVNCANPRKAS